MDDTIAAIATAPGASGLAVVRLSGPQAIAIADRIARGRGALAVAATHTLHHGWAVWPEADEAGGRSRIDEVVTALFRAPRSYTREDVVEFSCHGGRISAARVLEAALAAGARLARPGEFTLRAFLNGRVDLAQAEAVVDVIQAETERAHTLALSQLAGELSRRLEPITERIADALSEIEARVDFAEDVGGIEVPPHVIDAIAAAATALGELLEGAAFARAVRDGLRLPIIGRPNVGKSSLFNALVGEERAIVAATPGTTRDRITESIDLDGVRVTLSDLAGLRDTGGPVEAQGIARAREALAQSPIALWVVDGSAPLEDQDRSIATALAEKTVVAAINKVDLEPRVVGPRDLAPLLARSAHEAIPVSAARGDGLGVLRAALIERIGGGASGGAAVSNPRHAEALGRARAALERAGMAGATRAPGEIVALELREALEAVGEVTGARVTEDLLDRIFARFCIGK